VAADGRVEPKSRIWDHEGVNHSPIKEVCGLTRGPADFFDQSRANASFRSSRLIYICSCTLRRPHPDKKLVTNPSPKLRIGSLSQVLP